MQIQLCNPNLPGDANARCNPLRGYADYTFPRYDLWSSPSQRRAVEWIDDIISLGLLTISGIVAAVGSSSLTARYRLEEGIQAPLPADQWQREVEHWVGASLTSIQGSLVEAASGPSEEMMDFLVPPNGTEQESFCRSQKIISTQYSSFSVLGVGLIFAIGGIIILLDLILEPAVSAFERRRAARGRGSASDPERAHARLEWHATATLQLQRMAHEQAGRGTWSNTAGAVPVARSGETLAVLDFADESHPLLRADPRLPPKSDGDEKNEWLRGEKGSAIKVEEPGGGAKLDRAHTEKTIVEVDEGRDKKEQM